MSQNLDQIQDFKMYATNSLFNAFIATCIADGARTRDVLCRLSQKRKHCKYHHELLYRLWCHRILVASDRLFAQLSRRFWHRKFTRNKRKRRAKFTLYAILNDVCNHHRLTHWAHQDSAFWLCFFDILEHICL